uniref:Uncharacterized protein n=1 Tax=viral metagenome TaxID=1070528 RepID=A0A6C0KU25_9ZZZZ
MPKRTGSRSRKGGEGGNQKYVFLLMKIIKK